MSISLKANAAGTQGEILLNGSPVLTLNQNKGEFSGVVLDAAPAAGTFLTATFVPVALTTQKIPFAGESYDFGNLFNTTTRRMEIATRGLYAFNFILSQASAGQKAVTLYKNGAAFIMLSNVSGPTAPTTINGYGVFEGNPGDYFELFGYFADTTGIGNDTVFQAHLVKALP